MRGNNRESTMDQSEIEVILQDDLSEVARVLTGFLERSNSEFTFPSLSEDNRRMLVWTGLFQHLQASASTPVHALCLTTIKILSRDKTDLESLVCENWMNILVERAGLYHLVAYDEESLPCPSFPHRDIVIEALKCLYNLTFNSEVARGLCARSCVAEGLVCRLRVYRDLPENHDILLFDMRLLFIMAAFRDDFRNKIKCQLHGMEYLVNCLKEILAEAAPSGEGGNRYVLSDEQQALVCEILRIQFKLVSTDSNDGTRESEESVFLQITPLLFSLLLADTASPEKKMELHINVVNFLTSVPVRHYPALSPRLGDADGRGDDGGGDADGGEAARAVCEGCNMDAVQALLDVLHHRLRTAEEPHTQLESVAAVLTAMYKASRSCRAQRKYLRGAILPPLTDVSRPPERGDALRNRLCRLLTSPVTPVRDLAAEFLFVLCKENVGRMVKYTGFGNAAGLLAQRGLLGGGGSGGGGAEDGYSSSSDDSDTEEYRAAQPRLDPVVGCTRPPRVDPLQGMSEEQKEYEAMRLVGLLERLNASGAVRPARIGADGRPEPVAHILQLRDEPPPA